MVGLGGGFILVPILRLFMGFSPAYAAGTSLILIVANSASGAFTYILQRRVHLRIGWLIAAGGLPGGILGAIVSLHISARLFDTILAIVLIGVAIDMAWNAERRMAGRVERDRVAQIKGMSYRGALALGFVVGIFSSLFGLGGGILLVPTFCIFRTAGARDQRDLAVCDFADLTGRFGGAHMAARYRRHDVVPLVAGGLLGGPVGARLSLKLKSPQLLVVVAIALVTAAVSLSGANSETRRLRDVAQGATVKAHAGNFPARTAQSKRPDYEGAGSRSTFYRHARRSAGGRVDSFATARERALATVLEIFRGAPRLDYRRLRKDLDAIADPDPRPRG